MEKIEILLPKKPTQYPIKFSKLWRENEKKVIVSTPIDSIPLRNHFFVSDQQAYRFEEEHTSDDFNEGKVKASVNFNDKKTAKILVDKFTTIDKNYLKPPKR